jgi:atypical dual specificity phosphatase
MTSQQALLKVYWLPEEYTSPGMLSMSMLPGRTDIGHSLNNDLKVLAGAGISHIVALIRDEEFSTYGVPNLFMDYEEFGFQVKHMPITDMGTATVHEMSDLLIWLSVQLKDSRRVLVHCAGGLGRTGLVVGCYLRTQGLSADSAIAEVRRIRSPLAIETKAQEDFIRHYPP